MESNEAILSASDLEQRVTAAITEFLLSKEKAVQNEIESSIRAKLPNPGQVIGEFEGAISDALGQLGKKVESSVISSELHARLPDSLKPAVPKILTILANEFQGAAGKIASAVQLNAEQLERRVAELAAELYNAVKAQLEAVLRAAVEALVTAMVTAIAKILKEVILPLVAQAIAKVVAMLLMAMATAVHYVVKLLVEAGKYLLQKLGMLVKYILEKVILMIVKAIVMFVLKLVFRFIWFMFGMPGGAFEAFWFESAAFV